MSNRDMDRFSDHQEIRSFDELRRDIEQSHKSLVAVIQRTKQSGPDQQGQWVLKRIKGVLEKIKKSSNRDEFVIHRLTAESAKLETELNQAEKGWLLAHPGSATISTTTTTSSVSTSSKANGHNSGEENRARIMRSNHVLDATTAIIRDIDRDMEQANEEGVNILGVMEEQGQALLSIQSDFTETNVSAKNAGSVLRRMAERAWYNRVFLYSIIFILFIADVCFLWFGFIKK